MVTYGAMRFAITISVNQIYDKAILLEGGHFSCSPSNERPISRAALPQLEVIIDAIVMALQLKLVKPGKLNHSLILSLGISYFSNK